MRGKMDVQSRAASDQESGSTSAKQWREVFGCRLDLLLTSALIHGRGYCMSGAVLDIIGEVELPDHLGRRRWTASPVRRQVVLVLRVGGLVMVRAVAS